MRSSVRLGLLLVVVLFLATLVPAAASAEQVSAGSVVHVVAPGETLARIAARYHVTVRAILDANPEIRNPNRIRVGQRIIIPTGAVESRISFTAGATSAVRQGTLAGRASQGYLVRAMGGQWLDVSVAATGDQAILVIWGQDGTVLQTDHAGVTAWRGKLPATQDYHINVRSVTAGTIDYTLQVIIPERIRFAAGATSATLRGSTAPSGSHEYVLKAAAGQTMSIDLTPTNGRAILIIWGEDGSVLMSSHMESDSYQDTLTLTEDYFVDVRWYAGQVGQYTLKVTIE